MSFIIGCKKPAYGPHEAPIIMKNIEALLHNEWITECAGPWGSMIVLAQKPHQENINNITDFIWRMCVSYRKLNSITEPFEYPIPRCDDSVTIVGVQVGGHMYFISLDAKQGYHQVRVVKVDQEKLAFFAPNGKKYTFTVMPFGPTNAPSFYTCMMNDFQTDWNLLFYEIVSTMGTIDNEPIEILANDEIFVSHKRIVIGSKIIIDDILLYSTHHSLLLLYLDCICKTFQKFRCSFQLKKCEFLKQRVEYVGHDLTSAGNCPAQSKFDMINDWPIPTGGQSLHSFIGLLNFYHKYIPYMELRLKPLRLLERTYRRKQIPQMAWTKDLISLFEELKTAITSSPVLARYDASKPTFIKTDWCALGMAWIIMQPDSSDASITATDILLNKGICNFDLSLTGARLQPIAYGSRACTSTESHFHSFVGEVSSGRWGFAKNRRYLWGNKFWWLCDCKAVREVLDYRGTIHMISRWAQELLGYNFEIVHRSDSMMRDVDSITRRYTAQYATHFMIAATLRVIDKVSRPTAYQNSKFHTQPTRIKHTHQDVESNLLPLTSSNIQSLYTKSISPTTSYSCDLNTPIPVSLATNPVNILYTASKSSIPHPQSDTYSTASSLIINVLAIDDITGSCTYWARNVAPPPFSWTIQNIPSTSVSKNALPHSRIYQNIAIKSFSKIALITTPIHIIDFTFIPESHGHIFEWLKSITFLISALSRTQNTLLFSSAWIPAIFIPQSLLQGCTDAIAYHLPKNWTFNIHHYSSTSSLDPIIARRVCIIFTHDTECCKPFTTPIQFEAPKHHSYNNPFRNIEITIDNETSNIPIRISNKELTSIATPTNHLSPRHIATLESSNHINQVYDPEFPIPEDTNISQNIHFQPHIIVYNQSSNFWINKDLNTFDVLQLYSIPPTFISSLVTTHSAPTPSIIQCTLPYKLRSLFMFHILANGGIQDKLLFSDDIHQDSIQCYFVKPIPTPNDWYNAYIADPILKPIMDLLQATQSSNKINVKHTTVTPKDVKHINSCFRNYLLNEQITYSNGRLTAFRQIPLMKRSIALIIVPQAMQRTIFCHYHASPSGGHAGEYKTLYRIRLRFLWAGMREHIKSWVKQCAECVAANAWRSRRSELYFSWPVTLPFYIMHVDLWSPGNTEIKGKKGYLLNSVCDLTQFTISSITYDVTALHLSQLFMTDVILNFGMCAVIVVDAGSNFRGIFEEMSKLLDITFWPLARGNHKGNGAERYHRYLNKVQTIEGNNVGSNTNFMRIAKTTQYAWNSAPIDGTDIVRSMAAVGRDFRFPLDVKLSEIPTPNDSNNNALYDYLRNVSTDSKFATSILQILIEERRMNHQKRLNKNRTPSNLKVGDIVKAHVQVQSNAASGTVDKLSYKARGPFKIIKELKFDSFEVQDYHKPTAATRKYKSTELYLLPPSLYPCEPLDTMDHRYLHYEHAPIVSPLSKPLQIEAYNQQWFENKPTLPLPLAPVTQPNSLLPIDKLAFQPHIPSIKELNSKDQPDTLFVSTNSNPYPEPTLDTKSTPTTITSSTLHTNIELSTDRLFFIQFTPEDTLRPKWFLVQIDLEMTTEYNQSSNTVGTYVCSFLARHPKDINKTDERSRWWPDWYSYKKKNNVITYGQRVLFRPNITPDSSKYILWATPISLTDHNNHYLLGPFNFRDLDNTYRTHNTIDPTIWLQLYQICLAQHLHPPTIGIQTKTKPQQTKLLSKRKRQQSPATSQR